MVTALAALTMLPFTGCSSSQQQQAGDEVEASEEQQGGESGQAEASNQQSGSGEETAATGEESGNPAAGSEVVTNDAVQANGPAGEGDLQEIVQEMGNGNGSQAAAPAVNEAAPAATAAVDAGDGSNQAAPAEAPANVAPANAASTATVAAEAAPAPAAVGGLPETGSKMPYIVEAGDTLGKISTKVYGDQKRWRDISSLTGLSDPNHIFPGDVVYYALDEKSSQFAANYESIKRGKEVVDHLEQLFYDDSGYKFKL
jgi:nucleoid-associated protein YgaU